MAATGRSYYPNIPGPLEQALAPSVADGTSVWGPLMMMSARHERQQAYDDVNETQAQQFLLGLQGALDQAGVKARADILGQMARGGHMGGAMMRAANEGGLGTFDPNDIATQTLLGNAGELAGVGKTIGEAENAGAQGGNTPDLSQLAAGLGMPLTKSAPLGVQEHNIAAEATRYAADRGLEGKMYGADHKSVGKGKGGPTMEYTGTSPLGGNATVKGLPMDHATAERYLGKDTADKIAADPSSATVNLTGQSELTPTGDSIQRDPELPHILTHVTEEAKAHGAALVGAQGNPRYGKNKKGQKVVVVDAVMPDGSHTTIETPVLRQ